MSDPAEFAQPDWTLPIDEARRVSDVPEDATIRGLFVKLVLAELEAADLDPGGERYVAFARYPVREYNRVALDAAKRLYPELPLREGLYRLGRSAYPGFKATLAGTAIFAFAGDDFLKVARLAHKAYQVALDRGKVEVRELGERHLEVRLREIWNFADCLQVGVWAGAMDICNVKGRILMRGASATDVDLDITWD